MVFFLWVQASLYLQTCILFVFYALFQAYKSKIVSKRTSEIVGYSSHLLLLLLNFERSGQFTKMELRAELFTHHFRRFHLCRFLFGFQVYYWSAYFAVVLCGLVTRFAVRVVTPLLATEIIRATSLGSATSRRLAYYRRRKSSVASVTNLNTVRFCGFILYKIEWLRNCEKMGDERGQEELFSCGILSQSTILYTTN